MQREYLRFLKQLLSKSLNLGYKEGFIEENIETNKTYVELGGCTMSLVGESKINLNLIFAAVLIFSAFDFYLEGKYEQFADEKSYRAKYKALPSNSDIEKTQKNIYRVLKTIRNAFIHNIGNIENENEKFLIDYRRNCRFKVEVSKECLNKICNAMYLIIEYNPEVEERGQIFKEGMLSYYNNAIINDVMIEDDIGGDFLECDAVPLNPYRCTVRNTVIEVNGESIMIKNSRNSYYQSRDFLFNYNGIFYKVPEEYLKDCKIKVSELSSWKVAIS